MFSQVHKHLIQIALLLAATSPTNAKAQALGDTAEVLPQGLFKADVNHVYASTGLRTQSTALPDTQGHDGIALLIDLLGASTDFGTARIQYEGSAQVIAPVLSYGLHRRLSLALVVPVFLNARVDIHELQVGSGAIGFNPDFAKDPSRQSPVLSAQDPRAIVGPEGVQRLLTDVFEYDRLENWSSSGVGDVQAIGRLLALSSPYARLSVQGGITLPTGNSDDINNLVDFGLGDGQADFGWLGLVDLLPTSWLTLNLRGGYTVQFANQQSARIIGKSGVPLVPIHQLPDQFADLGQRGTVRRDLGDIFQVGSTLHLATGILVASARFDYISKGRDIYTSTLGHHEAMGADTAYSAQSVGGMLGIDLVESFLSGSAPAPLVFQVSVTKTNSDSTAANLTTLLSSITLYFGAADNANNLGQ